MAADADLDLDEAASVTLNGAGYGVARVGPGRPGLRWLIDSLALLADGVPTLTPRVYIYKGDPSPGKHITSSYNGNQNSSDGMSIVLHSGQALTAEWVGGDPGRRYTLSVWGKRSA